MLWPESLDTFSGYLSTNQLQGDPRETNLIAILDAVPGSQLPADFDLIAPEELGVLFDMEFGSVDTIVGNVQSRMNDLRNGYASPERQHVAVRSRADPVMQLASADRSLPLMRKAGPNDDWSAFAGGYGQFVNVSGTRQCFGLLSPEFRLHFGLRQARWTIVSRVGSHWITPAVKPAWSNGGSANMEGGRGGIYGTWFGTNAYLEAQVGAGGEPLRQQTRRAGRPRDREHPRFRN